MDSIPHIKRPAGSYKLVPAQRHIVWNKYGPAGNYRKGELAGKGYTLALDVNSDSVVSGKYLYLGNCTYEGLSKTMLKLNLNDLTTPVVEWSSKAGDLGIANDVGGVMCLKKRVIEGITRIFIYEVELTGAVFSIWDITDHLNISRVGSCDITGCGMPAYQYLLTVESLYEDYALVGKVGKGIVCIDCTDVTAPVVISEYEYPKQAITENKEGNGLLVAGRYVYTFETIYLTYYPYLGAKYFVVLDYEDVANPVVVGQVAKEFEANRTTDMLIRDNQILAFTSSSMKYGIKVELVDVTTKSAPLDIGYVRFGEELSQAELDAGEALGWEPTDPPYVNLYLGKPSKFIDNRFFYICSKWVPLEYPTSMVSVSVVLCNIANSAERSSEAVIDLTERQWDADDDSMKFASGLISGDIGSYSTDCLYSAGCSDNYDYLFMFKIKNIVEGFVK